MPSLDDQKDGNYSEVSIDSNTPVTAGALWLCALGPRCRARLDGTRCARGNRSAPHWARGLPGSGLPGPLGNIDQSISAVATTFASSCRLCLAFGHSAVHIVCTTFQLGAAHGQGVVRTRDR